MIRPGIESERKLIIDVLLREGLPARIDSGTRKLRLKEKNDYNNMPFAIAVFEEDQSVFINKTLRRMALTTIVTIISTAVTPAIDSEGKESPSLLETFRTQQGIAPKEISIGDKWYQMTFSPELGQNEQPTGRTLVITTDITETKLREREQQDNIARLEENNSRLGHTLDNLLIELPYRIHNLRGPLTTISGYAQMARNALDKANIEAARRHLDRVISGTTKASEEVTKELEELLDLQETKPEIIAAADFLETVVVKNQDKMNSNAIESITEPVDPSIKINIPIKSFVSIFGNLITNAVHAMPQGGSLTIAANTANGELVFTITDTGSGIAEEDQKKLFDSRLRFTTKEGTKQKGSGIGLSMSKRRVEEFGGRLWLVKSEIGKGSTFAVAIPLYQENNQLVGALVS